MDLNNDGLFAKCALGFLPNRLAVLHVLTPEDWAEIFRFIDRNVSILIEKNEISVFSDLSIAAVSLSGTKRLNSLSDFCLQIDDKSRKTLCGLLMLFSKLAIKLDEADSVSLSSSLMSLSQDLTKMGNYPDTRTHPLHILAKKLAKRYDELPED